MAESRPVPGDWLAIPQLPSYNGPASQPSLWSAQAANAYSNQPSS